MEEFLTMSVLSELKEIAQDLDMVQPDSVDNNVAPWLNKAKNKLAKLISYGEHQLDERLYKRDTRFD